VLALATMAGLPLVAQSGLTILSPAPNARLKAGPDFATDVLGDPWDMSNAEDISPDPAQFVGWSSFGLTGQGEVGGTTTSSAASFALMSPGFLGGLNSGRTGLRYPIDSATYSQISFRLKIPQGHTPRVYWYHNGWYDPAGLGYGVRFADTATGGYQIFQADLTKNLSAGSPWNAGVVRSLRFDPTIFDTPVQALFDWVRLTVPDTHPAAVKQTITWTGSGGPVTLTVVDAGGTAYKIASGLTGSSYTWSYGFLPPGAYTLRITNGIQTVSQPFAINAPPVIHLTDPDETGGEDFATKVLGNPWDMNDASDLRTVPDDHVPQKSFANGILSGVSDGVITNYYGTAPGGDAQLFLLTGNASIDPNRYRYFTIRMRVDDPFDLLGGSIGRVLWGSKANQPYSLTVSREWLVWPGWNTYTFDLGSLNTSTYGGIITTEGNKLPWAASPITSLRIDPHEFAQLKGFQIDYVKLAAVDEAKGSFVIRWTGGDPDNNPATVALYRDTNRNVADGTTFIGTANAAAGQYVWNTSGVPSGTYWIYAVVSDSLNATGSYSTGPVQVLSGAAASDPLVAIDTPTARGVSFEEMQAAARRPAAPKGALIAPLL